MHRTLLSIVASVLAVAPPACAQLKVDLSRPLHDVPASLYGVFFEEINYAAEGGIVAQLLRNPNFEESWDGNELGTGWKTTGITFERSRERPWGLGAVALVAPGASSGILENRGHDDGISVAATTEYVLDIESNSSDARGEIIAEIVSSGGDVLCSRRVECAESTWHRDSISLAPVRSDDAATLRVSITGGVVIDALWLRPVSSTASGSLRPDLARLVADLRPAFVRFPGGCFVEGGDFLSDAFRWKQTLGDAALRRGHRNTTWGYWTSDLLGYHEYLLWCESLSATAMYVANCGLSHKDVVPMDQLQPWIDECLDAIEYAIGPADSRWGSKRAAAGHPAPFNLRYIEIGNENGMFGGSGGSVAQYTERYRRFYDAIKDRYPDILTIADTRIDAPMEIVDDHFYASPQWFWENVHRYDTHPRNGPRVYVGEYAVTQGCGLGNMAAALGEAAFMTGLERNSDVVTMASYAPMFTHATRRAWIPCMMVFDKTRSFGTPSYYVQQLFAANRPDRLVTLEFPDPVVRTQSTGSVALGTWRTGAEFKDVLVQDFDGNTLYDQSRDPDGKAWRFDHGTWARTPGSLTQHAHEEMCLAVLENPELAHASDYILTLKARKIDGDEGFLIGVRATSASELTFWNIGGWGNREHAFEKVADGGKSALGAHTKGSVDAGRWYDIRVEARADHLRAFIDGVLTQEATDKRQAQFTAVAGRDDRARQLVIKAVNATNTPILLKLDVTGGMIAPTGRGTILSAETLMDENTLDQPTKVSPRSASFDLAKPVEFPPRSLMVIRADIRQ